MREYSRSERSECASEGAIHVLRTTEGADALTIEDLSNAYLERSIALGHLAALMALAALRRAERIAEGPGHALTAAARHHRDYGHELEYGCCLRRQVDELLA